LLIIYSERNEVSHCFMWHIGWKQVNVLKLL